MKLQWVVYALQCRSRSGKLSIYTGATNNFRQRWLDHCTGNGAKYTKAFKPLRGIIIHLCKDKSEALKMEHKFKQYSSFGKLQLINEAIRKNNTIYVRGEVCVCI